MNSVKALFDDRPGERGDSAADRNTKKVCFKDGSDVSLANMAIDSSPASVISWKDKLLSGAVSNSLDRDADLDLEFAEGDIHRSNLHGIPVIDLSERINNILFKRMELTVVVKLLGHNIGYGALFNCITSLWKPVQPFRLMGVANGFYLVRFQCKEDYEVALSQSPWIVFGHYLTIQPWTVKFNPSRPFPSSILAWIRFPGLSGFLYQKKILEEIGNLVGRVVKLDIKTDNRERGQFSRMTVFVNLEKPLTSQVLINGRLQRVEFEAFPEICFSYGNYGHFKNSCTSSLTGKTNSDGESNLESLVNGESAPVKTEGVTSAEEAYGPWMMVERKSMRKQGVTRGQKLKSTEGITENSRSVLVSSKIWARPLPYSIWA
ncbi:hypothetical protein J1N35_006360 [Gossypium stocksii]|uniref:DUF4283 domain-containing protein n=1 Tax=Gossypium stocksii TaxID=47602 RepID=A0A9D4AK56_9ROSI|nr:hypothetical protein J1N35_006360 [Gossypium stocksii]